MTDRKQARAMDLPDYPCPPNLGQIANRAGSWGWFNAAVGMTAYAVIARDADDYLWVKADLSLSPERDNRGRVPALATWTEGGIALFVPREAYRFLGSIDGEVDEAEWVPVAEVLREPPAYALDFIRPTD